MLQSILDAKEILGKMAFNDSVTQVKDILLEKNEDFWQPLSQLIALLKPISKAIGILESDDSKISETPQVLNDLFTEMTIVSNEFFHSIESEVNYRNGTIQRRLTCNSQ
jgi:LysM repeat protein